MRNCKSERKLKNNRKKLWNGKVLPSTLPVSDHYLRVGMRENKYYTGSIKLTSTHSTRNKRKKKIIAKCFKSIFMHQEFQID